MRVEEFSCAEKVGVFGVPCCVSWQRCHVYDVNPKQAVGRCTGDALVSGLFEQLGRSHHLLVEVMVVVNRV